VVLGADQSIRAYDYHSVGRTLTSSSSGLQQSGQSGTLMLDNSEGSVPFVFSLRIAATNPDGLDMDTGYLSVADATRFPAAARGEIDGHDAEFLRLPLGGCPGIECDENETAEEGKLDGTPTASDGDPVYEDEEQGPGNSTAMVAIAIVGAALVGVIAWFLYSRRRVRYARHWDEVDREEEISESEEDAPQVLVGQEIRAYPDVVAPLEPDEVVEAPTQPPVPYPGYVPPPFPGGQLACFEGVAK
jgi:hypothetical protein